LRWRGPRTQAATRPSAHRRGRVPRTRPRPTPRQLPRSHRADEVHWPVRRGDRAGPRDHRDGRQAAGAPRLQSAAARAGAIPAGVPVNSEDSISESLAQLQARANLQPPPELRARVCSRCTHDLRPRRGLSRGARLVLSALLGTGTVLLLWIVGGRGPDTLNAVLLGTAAWGGVLGAVLLLGLGRTGTCPASAGARWAMLILLPIAFCGGLMFVSQHMLPMTDFFRADQVWRVLPCGSLALGIGALVSGGIMLLWRRTD